MDPQEYAPKLRRLNEMPKIQFEFECDCAAFRFEHALGVAQRAVKNFLDEEKGSKDSDDDAKSARERTLDTVFAKSKRLENMFAMGLPVGSTFWGQAVFQCGERL